MNLESPFQSPFHIPQVNKVSISKDTQIVFVSDMYLNQFSGGAELTTQALIDSCQLKYQCILSKDVSIDLLQEGYEKYWIFGNFSSMPMELIPTIVKNMNYSVIEYDYKYCRYRSAEKHAYVEQTNCDCNQNIHGKLISAFYYGAKSMFWMSESQLDIYLNMFPFLADKENIVLSSVFDHDFFAKIKSLREKYVVTGLKNNKYVVLRHSSWIKGTDASTQYCIDNKLSYEVVGEIPYQEMLEKLAQSKGLVYLPVGKDTCPRLVIEAKLLSCDLVLNDNVQHKNEEWFATDDLGFTFDYLYAARQTFWDSIEKTINYVPKISGYLTTCNCIDQKYPYVECIKSLLDFCDEVVVLDANSNDGTRESLLNLQKNEPKLNIVPSKYSFRSNDERRFALNDGQFKAQARAICTGDILWQMDSDEIAPAGTRQKILDFYKVWPKTIDLVCLPVVEYWGSEDKVRVDVNPWKWRMSRNTKEITHGVPRELRINDKDGNLLYAKQGTDGCDYVDPLTYTRTQHVSFYTEEAHNARMHALNGNVEALKAYEQWLQMCVATLPSVKHYSWIDIERKIKTYRDYWQAHWESLYNIKQEDTAQNNMFFDKQWSEVTDIEIKELAERLSKESGGHIFHTKVDWNKPQTQSIRIKI